MKVYRLSGKEYSSDLHGTGAALYGGRWNKKGSPVLYTGESIEIALLETIAHTPPMLIPRLDLVTLEIPPASVLELHTQELPKNWYEYPAPSILAEIAEDWIRSQESIALKVPSCIVPSAHNYILNCRHPQFRKVKIVDLQDFHFDRRLNS